MIVVNCNFHIHVFIVLTKVERPEQGVKHGQLEDLGVEIQFTSVFEQMRRYFDSGLFLCQHATHFVNNFFGHLFWTAALGLKT